MRRLMTALALLGLTATLAAQTPGPQVQVTGSMLSSSINQVNGVRTFKDLVLTVNGVTIKADQAVMSANGDSVELEGHVVLSLKR